MNLKLQFAVCGLILLLPTSVSVTSSTTMSTGSEHCTTPACGDLGSNVINSMKTSISACQDFYEFACSANTVENDALKQVEKEINEEITRLLREPKNTNEPTSVHKLKEAFSACMNENERKRRANAELKHFIEHELGGWPILNDTSTDDRDGPTWEVLAGKLRRLGYSLVIKINVNIDRRNRNRHVIELDRGRPEYVPRLSDKILSYLSYIAAQSNFIHDSAVLLGARGGEDLKEDIQGMLRFQMKINQLMNDDDDDEENARNPYNVMTISELNKFTSNKIDWLTLLKTTFNSTKQIGLSEEVVVLDNGYLTRLADLIEETDKRVIINYLIWRVVRDVAEDGDPNMVALNRAHQENRAQHKLDICIKEVKGFLGFAVTNLYVRHNDQRQYLTTVATVVDYVKSTFKKLIEANNWMDPPTKEKALIKLQNMWAKIGYPSWIVDSKQLDKYYENVRVSPRDHFSNILNLSYVYSLQELDLINSTPDPSSWVTSPLLVNAFYHRTLNEIYIPVAILRRPFVDPLWPMAAAFGGIGAVVGHEITHGFDDESFTVAANGSLVHWWTSATTPRYKKATQCITHQYNSYCPTVEQEQSEIVTKKQVCINGQKTLRENVADIGGVKASYHAYQQWKERNGNESLPTALQKYTTDQMFFLSFAQIWCTSTSPAVLLRQLQTSSNSPNKYRLLGSLKNLADFNNAFDCTPPPTTSSRDKLCNIW